MALHDNVFKLVQAASSQGLHGGDILVEIRTATLAAGTVEVPTVFSNGSVLAMFVLKSDSATVNAVESYTTDLVVTTGAITLSGPTGSTAVVRVAILGRLEV